MSNTLSIPKDITRAMLTHGGVAVFKYCSASSFVSYCKKRDLKIDRKRLLTLEKIGIFTPIFRINDSRHNLPISIPLQSDTTFLNDGTIVDTISNRGQYSVPEFDDDKSQAYYSIFQIDKLAGVLAAMTVHVELDSYLESFNRKGECADFKTEMWLDHAARIAESFKKVGHREGISLLCQYISDRYGPYSRTNQRNINYPVGPILSSDHFHSCHIHDWDWHAIVKSWDPHDAEKLFSLTPEKLQHAYETLSHSQQACDPIEKWYQLIQFVSYEQKLNLKGLALRAESLRVGCEMLKRLHKDLYDEELPHPNEIYRTVIVPFPEKHIRKDTRRYLEFVVNRYDLNPQPKVTLFVEGQSEERAVQIIFESYFGAHPGKFGIEVVSLKGVDNATGSKEDRFRAILRLVDYLHTHQTFTFLILDNENYAMKLKQSARRAKSIHGSRRHITRADYIKVWRESFELDNFSATEIANGLNTLSSQNYFMTKDIIKCKSIENPTNAISKLYKSTTNYGLNKIKLSEVLVKTMFSDASRRNPENRPIVKTLRRVIKLAIRNPFPSRHESWENNQQSKFFGKKGN